MRFTKIAPVVFVLGLATVLLAIGNNKHPNKPTTILSKPYLRSIRVTNLARKAQIAKTEAWTKAKRAGWQLKGQANGNLYELMAITKNGRPVYNITNNANAAISTAADLVRNTNPYNLNGSGLIIGIWDGSNVRASHQEFDGRVNVIDNVGAGDHATHVAGTIGAKGIVSAAGGMAPSIHIDSYDWNSDTSEMTAKGASYPDEPNTLYLSNHSYGSAAGWAVGDWSGNYGPHWFGVWGDPEDEYFGMYTDQAALWDQICYEAPYYLPFKSAGNDRNDTAPAEGATFYYLDLNWDWHSKTYNPATDPPDDSWDNGGFDTIPSYANAKNIMTVGAVEDAVNNTQRDPSKASMAFFSAWGPTDDKRIKPDIVANGMDLYSCIASSDASYSGNFFGTSMSSPNAAGSAALLVQLYNRLFPGQAMRSSTLKGLIIHTADDLGNAGPDYSFGWGLMNTKAAADLIMDHNNFVGAKKIIEDLLDTVNTNNTYYLLWDGSSSIRATLCWTDPNASPTEGLDNPSPRLVNDLDMRITGPNGSSHYPYVLDAANPANLATTADNTVDNVEQIYIANPVIPGIYTIQISHKGTLTNGQQHYSLIVSGQSQEVFLDGDLDNDGDVDPNDLAILTDNWLETDCADCNNADLTSDEDVNLPDFTLFAKDWLYGTGPEITLSANTIKHSSWRAYSLPNDAFITANSGTDTLNYQIQDDADWLHIEPNVGTLASDTNATNNVTYNVEDLPAGTHTATITVAGNAYNAPKMITVSININRIPADFDGDGDVDQSDFGHLQTCYSSSLYHIDPGCEDCDLNKDETVDQADSSIFQGCMSGADTLADPNCCPN